MPPLKILYHDQDPVRLTLENYIEVKKDLRLFLAGEIGRYLTHAGSYEKLSLLLNKSPLYVRMIVNRQSSIEKLEKLLKECQKKIKL